MPTQDQLRQMHQLPASAFDIIAWVQRSDVTGRDEVLACVRWREARKSGETGQRAFVRVGADGVPTPVADYELTPEQKAQDIIHDYTQPRWGHSIASFTPANEAGAEASGFGEGLGHHVLLRQGGQTTRYRVEQLRYARNPSDMWFATLRRFTWAEPAGKQWGEANNVVGEGGRQCRGPTM